MQICCDLPNETDAPEQIAWRGMLVRCRKLTDAAYAFYGAKGIDVCERWLQYSNFLADMGRKPSPRHSIERVDNAKGYSAENCIWADAFVQAQNRRSSLLFTLNGKTQCLKAWARELEKPYRALHKRVVEKGWPIEIALAEPFLTSSQRRETGAHLMSTGSVACRYRRTNKEVMLGRLHKLEQKVALTRENFDRAMQELQAYKSMKGLN